MAITSEPKAITRLVRGIADLLYNRFYGNISRLPRGRQSPPFVSSPSFAYGPGYAGALYIVMYFF